MGCCALMGRRQIQIQSPAPASGTSRQGAAARDNWPLHFCPRVDYCPRVSKASDPPTCRVCGAAHWGTCMNHNARGAIADQAPVARRAGVPARTKSTAARKDVHVGWLSGAAVEIEPNAPPAGTQAPPVDTNSRAKATRAKPPARPKAGANGVASRPRPGRAGAPAAKKAVKALRDKGDIIPAEAVKRGRGRPKTVEDRKAYKAQKERERRAKKKPIEASK